MTKLELSIFDHSPYVSERVRNMLVQFEKQERIHVNLEVLSWKGGWERMVNVALYGEGLDVSEVGSTWIGDFVKMEALSRFEPADMRLVGMSDDFVPACWSSGITKNPDGGENVWSIPWSADTRVLYYRRDLLEKVGIDEKTAFSTLENFENTLRVLKEKGTEIPFTMPMGRSRQQIHVMASFIWKAGGGFISSNGKEIIFNNPEARAGMRAYFRMGKYLVSQARQLSEGASEDAFIVGNVAVSISGTWVLTRNFPAHLRPYVGTGMLPGIPWVGGSNFVIWKNCRAKREAVRLLRFLTNSAESDRVFPDLGLPTRRASLNTPFYTTDPNWKVMQQAILAGRGFSTEQLWGLVETRLTDLLPHIWERVLADEDADIDAILDQFIPSLARRLTMTLSARP